MKNFYLSYAAIALVGSIALLALDSKPAALSFGIGCLLMMLNVVGLHFVWNRILVKKQVARPLGVIVFKYAILGFIIYWIVSQNLLEAFWFLAGFSVVIVSALAATLRRS